MKVGSTESGAAAAASHTAAMAGSDAVYDSLFERYGAFRAGSTEEVLDIAYALSVRKTLKPRKLGVLTVSGGAGVQIADFAANAGIALQSPDVKTKAKLRDVVPYGSVTWR